MKINFLKAPSIIVKYPIAFSIAVFLHIVLLVILFLYQDKVIWEPPMKIEKGKQNNKLITPLPIGVFAPKLNQLIEEEKQRIIDDKKQKALNLRNKRLELERLMKESTAILKEQQLSKLAHIQEEKAVKIARAKRIKEEESVKRVLIKKIEMEKRRKKEELAIKTAIKEKEQIEIQKKDAIKKRIKEELAAKIIRQNRLKEELTIKENQVIKKRLESEIKNIKIALSESIKRFKKEKLRHELNRDLAKEEIEENQTLLDNQFKILKSKYIALISASVQEHWRFTSLFKKSWRCKVIVRQDKSGIIKVVNVVSCNTDSVDFRRTVKSAVLKANPLPLAPTPEVFDHIIQFEFQPYSQ
jgi:colicin import membrane protein